MCAEGSPVSGTGALWRTYATVYFGAVEIRNWKVAGQEQVLTYPHPAVKLVNGTTPAAATYLHRDGLSLVRAITNAAGVKIEAVLYKPFGEQSEWVLPGNAAPETKGWIGERYDADAGLQYLNARYYDPELSLSLQPDWFEVTKAGVGTNRFSYSFNDPVNKFDPGGNATHQMSRDLDNAGGPGAHSATVVIASEKDKDKYPEEMQELFKVSKNSAGVIPGLKKGEKFYYIVISGQNSNNNEDYPNYGEGKLVAVINDAADIAAIEELASGDDSLGSYNAQLYDKLDDGLAETSDIDMDVSIFGSYKSYKNDMEYNLLGPEYTNVGQVSPRSGGGNRVMTGHNCHGFAQGLAETAGAMNYTTDVFGYDPGNGTPFPRGAFDHILGGP